MSDSARQNLGDKMSSTMKPEGQKSYTEQAKEKLDNVASGAQPESEKSYTQKAADTITEKINDATSAVKDAFSNDNTSGNANANAGH
jgi:hypothetical protein